MNGKMNNNEQKYSQLKAMFAISKASFRSITRSPSAVIFTLVFPLIFITVFGFLKGGSVSLDVALSPGCDTKNPIYIGMISNPAFSVQEKMDTATQKKLLLKGTIDAIVNIQRSATDSTYNVKLYTTMASAEKGVIVESMLEHMIDKLNLKAANISQPMATIQQEQLTGRTYETIDFILPGQLGFSLLSTGVFGTAFVFFNLRQTLVIKRFFATPIKRPFIVLGEALARMVFALLGAAFLITLGHYAFGFTLINGLSTFFDMIVLSAIGLIVFMGFGFVVSGIAKNEGTIPPLANIVTLPQFLLSGTFFGIDNFPSWLQPVCKILPLTYLNDAMRKVAFEGAGLMDVTTQLGVILLWGVIIYFAAVKVFRWE